MTIKPLSLLTALCLAAVLAGQPAIGADLFQWTDANGSLHFTDNLQSVPMTLRGTPTLTVRKNYFEPSREKKGATAEKLPPAPPASPTSENAGPVASDSQPQIMSPITPDAQDITIIIVNPPLSVPHTGHACRGPNCGPGTRANFNDRQYVHPSVFGGRARQPIRR